MGVALPWWFLGFSALRPLLDLADDLCRVHVCGTTVLLTPAPLLRLRCLLRRKLAEPGEGLARGLCMAWLRRGAALAAWRATSAARSSGGSGRLEQTRAAVIAWHTRHTRCRSAALAAAQDCVGVWRTMVCVCVQA